MRPLKRRAYRAARLAFPWSEMDSAASGITPLTAWGDRRWTMSKASVSGRAAIPLEWPNPRVIIRLRTGQSVPGCITFRRS